MAKISILVPIYNVEKYLRECLDSIINQTFTDIEIICVNDGSTDSSTEILAEYTQKDARIKVINKPNSGYGNSMNMALDAATSEYIGIVESDDFIDNNMYENLYKIAQKHPEINLIRSDWYYYKTAKNQSRKAGKIIKEGVVDIRKNLYLFKFQSIWSCLYKKEFLKSNNIRFQETPGASYQDVSFIFKCFCLAQNIYLHKKAYLHYRIDNENSSINSNNKLTATSDEYEEITRFVDSHPEIKEFVQATKIISQYRAYVSHVIRLHPDLKDKFLLTFQETFRKYNENNQIPEGSFRKINKKEFEVLLTDIDEYKKIIEQIQDKHKKRAKRNELFSIRINGSRLSVVILGKQIINIG